MSRRATWSGSRCRTPWGLRAWSRSWSFLTPKERCWRATRAKPRRRSSSRRRRRRRSTSWHPRSGHTYRAARRGQHGGHYGHHYGYSRHYSFGVNFGYLHYGYPYYGYPYYDYPYYGYYSGWPYGYAGPYAPAAVVVPAIAVIDLEIKPDKAEVWLDGDLIGIADDFDGYPDVLSLPPGKHTIVVKHPGYKDLTLRYDLQAGESLRVRRRMVRESSAGR